MKYSFDEIMGKIINNIKQIDYGDVQLRIIVRGGVICRYEIVRADSYNAIYIDN